jgi:hypothetical protein
MSEQKRNENKTREPGPRSSTVDRSEDHLVRGYD